MLIPIAGFFQVAFGNAIFHRFIPDGREPELTCREGVPVSQPGHVLRGWHRRARRRVCSVGGVGCGEAEDYYHEPNKAEEPADGVARTPRSDQSADCRVRQHKHRWEKSQIREPPVAFKALWERWGEVSEESGERYERQAEDPDRPGDHPSGAAARLADTSTLFPCPFCHNTTLQHYRLPNVTTTVTK